MAEIVRRWRVLWIGLGASVALSFLSVTLFLFVPKLQDVVLRDAGLVLAWVALVISPLLWLEFAVLWTLTGTPERWIRVGGALVFPALIAVVVMCLVLSPNSIDQLIQPVFFIWIVCVGMRLAHLWALTQSAKQD